MDGRDGKSILIVVNGLPKSGTHYLGACLELMGIRNAKSFDRTFDGRPHRFHIEEPNTKSYVRGHYKFSDGVPSDGAHFYIIRNPRNSVISWIRWERPGCKISEITEDMVLCIIEEFDTTGVRPGPFYSFSPRNIGQYYSLFNGWLFSPDCTVFKYEQMLTDGGSSITKIADILGCGCKGVYENAPKKKTDTNTFYRSDWTFHWTPAIDDAWRANGGIEIEERLGYVN